MNLPRVEGERAHSGFQKWDAKNGHQSGLSSVIHQNRDCADAFLDYMSQNITNFKIVRPKAATHACDL